VHNPLRSERDAFRMVLVTIGYLGLIGIGWKIDRWLGAVVFVVLTIGGIAWLVGSSRRQAPLDRSPAERDSGPRRILVLADESVDGPELREELRRRAGGGRAVVLVVSPATDPPAPADRLAASLVAMRAAGIDATGEIGDGDPIRAIADALRTFRADEIVVSTLPSASSVWLENGVVDQARKHFDLPVTHVIAASNGHRA
jgi:GABA permease